MLNNLNSILIEGNLVRDPEMTYTPEGTSICSFVLESQRFFKQGEETQKEISLFEVTCRTQLAEVCGEYLKKGRGVRVVGRLKQDRWTAKVLIVAEHVEFKPRVNEKEKAESEEVKST